MSMPVPVIKQFKGCCEYKNLLLGLFYATLVQINMAQAQTVQLESVSVSGSATTATPPPTYRPIASRSMNDRAGKMDLSIMYRYQGSSDIKFKAGDELSFESTDRWGFTVGYNFDNHLNFHWEFAYLKPDYTATLETVLPAPTEKETFKHKSSISTNQFNLVYHLFDGPITPYVQGGVGWMTIDSNIISGSGIYCSPWYPYYCYQYTNTYGDSSFSYNASLGLRWDISTDNFLRVSYGSQWADISKTKGTPEFEVARLELGWMFR